MNVEVNGLVKNVPSDVSDISLGIYIEWYNQYGKQLEEDLQAIVANDTEDKLLQELFIEEHLDKEAAQWFTFHTGHDFTELLDSPQIVPLLQQYRTLRFLLKSSELESYTYPKEIDWNGEIWVVQDWRVDAKSNMTFNEIITSKEVTRQIHKVGLGRLDALPYLCALFLRKKDEPFTDDLVHDHSERIKLMYTLPLNYAFSVAFFLSSCVNSLLSTLAYSSPANQEGQSQN